MDILDGLLNLSSWMCPRHCTPSYWFRMFVIINGSLISALYLLFSYFAKTSLRQLISTIMGEKWAFNLGMVFLFCALTHGLHSLAYISQYFKIGLLITYPPLLFFMLALLYRSSKAVEKINANLQKMSDDESERGLVSFINVLVSAYHKGTVMKCLVDGTTGYLRDCSDSWSDALGYSIIELQNTPFIDLVHPDDKERTLGAYNSKIFQDKKSWYFDNRYRKKDGTYIWIRWIGPTTEILIEETPYYLSPCFVIDDEDAKINHY